MANGNSGFCFTCDEFPCKLLLHLDKRYRTNYGMSMIENLTDIKNLGIRRFVKNENEKWTCPDCGAMISVHRPYCLACGRIWMK